MLSLTFVLLLIHSSCWMRSRSDSLRSSTISRHWFFAAIEKWRATEESIWFIACYDACRVLELPYSFPRGSSKSFLMTSKTLFQRGFCCFWPNNVLQDVMNYQEIKICHPGRWNTFHRSRRQAHPGLWSDTEKLYEVSANANKSSSNPAGSHRSLAHEID